MHPEETLKILFKLPPEARIRLETISKNCGLPLDQLVKETYLLIKTEYMKKDQSLTTVEARLDLASKIIRCRHFCTPTPSNFKNNGNDENDKHPPH